MLLHIATTSGYQKKNLMLIQLHLGTDIGEELFILGN